MLMADSRKILFYEFFLKSKPYDFDFDLTNELNKIILAYEYDQASYVIANGRACIRIQDVFKNKENDTVTLLINYSDKQLSNPGFQKIHSDELRKVTKFDDEGLVFSTHITLFLKKNLFNYYLGAVEQVPGLSKTIYMSLFNKILRDRCCTTAFDQDKRRTVKCWPAIDSKILESDEFIEALNKHPLRGIELLRYDTKHIDFDKSNRYDIVSQNLILKPTHKSFGKAALDFIKTCATLGTNKKYSVMKIRFNNQDGSPTSLTVGTTESDLQELYFGKKADVILNKQIDQCSEKIHTELMTIMASILISEYTNQNDTQHN